MTKYYFKSKEFLTKAIITVIMVLITGLSFLFANNIELALGLKHFYNTYEKDFDYVYGSDYFVTYLDVGQGNCTFVKLPDGKTMLIDGGNTMYGDKIFNYLRSINVSKIDYMIASHADSDHIGGLIKVLEQFEVKNIYRPFQICGRGTSYKDFVPSESEDLADVYYYYRDKLDKNAKISRVTSSVYNDFLTAAYSEIYFENSKECKSTVTVFYDGLEIGDTGYSIKFFAPEKREGEEGLELKTMSNTKGYATIGYGTTDSNNSSAIFLLNCRGSTFLFTGDAAFESGSSKDSDKFEEKDFVNNLTNEERALLSNVSVYLVGHHGSQYSSSLELISLINPKFAVVSVGLKNGYGHPSSEAILRVLSSKNISFERLLLTSNSGNLAFCGNYGQIYFAQEISEIKTSYKISWILLSSILCGVILIIVWNVKPKQTKS